MRDDDPTSLNDDFVRTFTISSSPKAGVQKQSEFDMTIRNVGAVTKYLFQQNDRAGFEVPVLGVGGDFTITQEHNGITPFIAGGVGITPLLGQLSMLDISPARFKLFWTLRYADRQIAMDTLGQHTELGKATKLFFTGAGNEIDGKIYEELKMVHGAEVYIRRLMEEDLSKVQAQTWYLCTGRGLREDVVRWLDGKKVVFEGFDY
jgi:ferredoxin-NADP reductase